MKKALKILTSLAAIGGIAAGAYALYKKYFALDTDDDFDDDFEDEFEDDFLEDAEETEEAEETAEREYVSLNPTETAVDSDDMAEKLAEAIAAEVENAKAEEEV